MHLFIIYLTRDRVCRAGKVIKDLIFISKRCLLYDNLVGCRLLQVSMIPVR